MSSRISYAAVATLVALAASLACGCETPPVSPSAMTAPVVVPARPSPDPPPARPLSIEQHVEGGAGTDAGHDAGGLVDDGGVGGITLDAGTAAPSLPPLTGADRVVSSLHGKFRACYKRGGADDPKQRGHVLLDAKISPEGNVQSVAPQHAQRLNERAVACMIDVLKAAHFAAPGGRGASLQVPVAYTAAR